MHLYGSNGAGVHKVGFKLESAFMNFTHEASPKREGWRKVLTL